MNYSTIKKVVALSLMSIVGLTAANAQTSSTSSTAKIFGGAAQYRSWSLGINAGVLAPVIVTGGFNDFTNWDANLGYGLTLRKQFSHVFGLEGSFLRGKLSGDNDGGVAFDRRSYSTDLDWNFALSGYVNFASISFLKRENNVNFFGTAGMGLSFNEADVVMGNNTTVHWGGGPTGSDTYTKAMYIPVGVGVKFKVSDKVNFNLGYTALFFDADNVDRTYGKQYTNDKASYSYAGVEFALGSSAKPNLDWVNPVALMYDELKDPSLRQELEALKGRVTTLENTVNQLGMDSDGDGVANKFDKCPGTPAGVQVDGAGCPIKFPEVAATPTAPVSATYPNIQFEFDSSVLRTSSYPTLDKLAADLKATTGSVTLEGHASSEGTDEYNMNLSKDRANSVKTYLTNAGIDASRINTVGYGESRPVASNATEEGRVTNRRVEIKK